MVNIEFTESEVYSLAGLLDAAVKTLGLRAVKESVSILEKLEKAAESIAPKNQVNSDKV